MSYDHLMQYAAEIEQSAVDAEWRRMNRMSSGKAPPPISYEELQGMYQNCARPLFEPFTRIPDPASYDAVIDDLYSAMGNLSHGAHMTDPITGRTIKANRDMQAIETAGTSLNDWTGAAASAFRANFLDPFPAVATNQFLVLGVMKGAAEADRAVWYEARENIVDIASRTAEALDNLGSCGKNDVEFALSVAAAVVSVAGIPFTAGASAVVAGVGAAVNATGAATKGVEAVKGGGGTAAQVLESMKKAIDELTGQIRDTQGQIAETLNGYAGEVDMQKNKEPSAFVSARPKLAGMKGAELTSGKGLGRYR